MVKIYACLVGNWVCLNEDPECTIGESMQPPSIWWEENASIYSPNSKKEDNSFYYLDYVHIYYKGKDYRINPIFIQIVSG